MKRIYMQDKRAKKTPPVGTKKYPFYYLGIGEEAGGKIKTDGKWAYDLAIKPKYFRFYGADEKEGGWFKNIHTVELGHYWHSVNVSDE